jgi:hypothetical protein
MLNTVDEVIEAVGGEEVAADLAGVGITAVLNWKGRDKKIPPKHFFLFSTALARRRLKVAPSVFGWNDRMPA